MPPPAISIRQAVDALGASTPLTEEALTAHVRPLFSRALAGGGNYLATHSLGRPLDQTADDLAEAVQLWAGKQRDAWAPWLAEQSRYRAALASLLGLARPDCVIPKTSAGQALRTVLNTLPAGATVLTTRGEFTSVALVLAQYAALGRIKLRFAPPGEGGCWTADSVCGALRGGGPVALLVLSHVFYRDSRIFDSLAAIAHACHHEHGCELLVDSYHALGVLPVNMEAIGCDYMIGGCYKYLRGGPGAAFLALAPHKADGVPYDSGWFAIAPGTDPWGEPSPSLLPGGDAWLDGNPPILTYYQARAGLAFTLALGIDRLRAWSLAQLLLLRQALAARGIESRGGDAHHGGFLTIPCPRAAELVAALARENIAVDERAGHLRLCPDLLTTRAELTEAADALARHWRSSGAPSSNAANSALTPR